MKKSNIVLVVILIALGLTVYYLESPSKEKEDTKPQDLGIMFPDFKSDEITKIEFGSFGGSAVLIKENDQWMVNDQEKQFPADAEAVSKALETVGQMTAKELISSNASKHITFQVNASQESSATDESGTPQPFKMGTLGTEVKMIDKDGVEKAHFFVGKNGAADFMSTYVRKNGTDNVVLVDGYLKATFGKGSAANWKDRILCKIDKSKLSKMILGEGKNQIVLEAQLPPASESSPDSTPVETNTPAIDIPWRMTAPEQMDIDKRHSDRLVNMFANFQATDYAPELADPKDYGFEAPAAIAKLQLTDGTEMTFKFGNESKDKTGQFFVQKEGDSRIFLVPKYRLDTVIRKVADFKEDPNKPPMPQTKQAPPPIEAKKTK